MTGPGVVLLAFSLFVLLAAVLVAFLAWFLPRWLGKELPWLHGSFPGTPAGGPPAARPPRPRWRVSWRGPVREWEEEASWPVTSLSWSPFLEVKELRRRVAELEERVRRLEGEGSRRRS